MQNHTQFPGHAVTPCGRLRRFIGQIVLSFSVSHACMNTQTHTHTLLIPVVLAALILMCVNYHSQQLRCLPAELVLVNITQQQCHFFRLTLKSQSVRFNYWFVPLFVSEIGDFRPNAEPWGISSLLLIIPPREPGSWETHFYPLIMRRIIKYSWGWSACAQPHSVCRFMRSFLRFLCFPNHKSISESCVISKWVITPTASVICSCVWNTESFSDSHRA